MVVPPSEQDAYDELSAYTLAHDDPAFIHQYVVDAFAAQYATPDDPPIRLAFALMGLCLHLERGYPGRQVQLFHMRIARKRRQWPVFEAPAVRGTLTPTDVVEKASGPERDGMIDAWCTSVWAAWEDSHESITAMIRDLGE
ncbi:MAG: hypothetical protein EPO16_03600 [Dehalococcoidia bacterium]|nr:MAG: hypothetical protein EPO16_03600 [Dehalococcoidia bacterium]